jgi:hypothetical protein
VALKDLGAINCQKDDGLRDDRELRAGASRHLPPAWICHLAGAGSMHTVQRLQFFAGRGHEVHLLSKRPRDEALCRKLGLAGSIKKVFALFLFHLMEWPRDLHLSCPASHPHLGFS